MLACRNSNQVEGRHESHVDSVEGKLNAKVSQQLELLEDRSRHHPNLGLGGAEEIEEATSLKDIKARLLVDILTNEAGCSTKSSTEGKRRKPFSS